MGARFEVTAKYARRMRRLRRRTRSRLLDEVVAVTGWSRDNARRRLAAAAKPASAGERSPGSGVRGSTPTTQPSCFRGLGCLRVVSGKYLAASMRLQLDGLERHGS